MKKSRVIAGLRVSRVTPTVATHKSLPDLAPPEERLRSFKDDIFLSDAITPSRAIAYDEVEALTAVPEREDVTARLTVYAMNMTVMVFAMPVGMALLILNILGGENLRTTAHVMALTGLFSALAVANPGLLTLLI